MLDRLIGANDSHAKDALLPAPMSSRRLLSYRRFEDDSRSGTKHVQHHVAGS
jgi:hypothetical protein